MNILNDTADLYRYYDLTRQAEYLYQCVDITIHQTIPEELNYLKRYDTVFNAISEHVSLPDQKVDLLIKMLQQNNGKLSKTKREKFFDELTGDDIAVAEKIFDSHMATKE